MAKKIIKGINDFKTWCKQNNREDLLAEWDVKKNAPLSVTNILWGSNKHVWWKCNQCGNCWQAIVSSRTCNKTGCPACGRKKQIESFRKNIIKNKGSLMETNPELCEEWNYSKNTNTPANYSFGSDAKVWWKCKRGHEWQAVISSRTKGCGCPQCNNGHRVSLPEKAIVYYLDKFSFSLIENAKIFGDSLRDVDIFIPKLKCAIEYDGEHWHKDRKRDVEKSQLCKKQGIRLIRIREPKIGLLNDGYSEEHITAHPKNDLGYLKETLIWLLDVLGLGQIDVDPNRDMPSIKAMIEKNYDNDSFGHLYPALALEWDNQKNGELKPNDISKCSAIKIWWLCPQNHSYQETVAHRTYGRNCPYCSGRRTLPGYNDLATKHPDLMNEWDKIKNVPLDPTTISDCNSRKVWWICSNGHNYQATIAHRTSTNSTGCPYCANQKVLLGYNDLLSQYPLVAKEWNYEKNKDLPENVVFGSNKKYWWKCLKCGNEWKTSVYSRTLNNSNCRKCSLKAAGENHHFSALNQHGSIKETCPELLVEWDYALNDKGPENYTKGSNANANWICKICGFHWASKISNRTILGRGCPKCAQKTRSQKKSKQVLCVETNHVYKSINEAAAAVGGNPSKISACCIGKQKTSRGYHWQYVE